MEKKNAKKRKGYGFVILLSISVVVMIAAVSMIYVYTRHYNPAVLQVNAQSESAVDNVGFINQDSPQVLERDNVDLSIRTFSDSGIFIIGSGVFMVVIVVSFAVVKFVESKDE